MPEGSHNQPPGAITDDTDLALCILDNPRTQETFDPADIAARFVDWYKTGPFDVRLMTADALLCDFVEVRVLGVNLFDDVAFIVKDSGLRVALVEIDA